MPTDVLASLPAWKRTVSQQRGAELRAQAEHVVKPRERALAAARRVARAKARLQREQHRVARTAAAHRQLERKREAAVAVSDEIDKLVGRDVTARLADAPLPDEAEVERLSVLFNQQLSARPRVRARALPAPRQLA